jgi:hypothetical protein
MKKCTKAALLSVFVFPGSGHFYLRHFWRGIGFALVVLGGLVFAVWSAVSYYLQHLDPSTLNTLQSGTASLSEASGIAASNAAAQDPYAKAIFYGVVLVWVISAIDAYRIGKQKDISPNE